MKIRAFASIAVVASLALGSVAHANVPLRFSAAQEQATSIILAVAHMTQEGGLRLEVQRTYSGVDVGAEVRVRAISALRGSELVDGQTYLVLLGNDREPFDSYRVGGTLPLLGCGIINFVQVKDGVVLDPGLYDTKYLGRHDTLKLSTIEPELKRSTGQKGG